MGKPASRRILIVDDDRLIRMLVRRALEMQGYDVDEADGGQAGLDAAAQALPALILLDYQMPDLDGPAVLRCLRAAPATARVPVLLLTASIDDQDVDAAIAAGANGVIAKPVRPASLAEHVRVALAAEEP